MTCHCPPHWCYRRKGCRRKQVAQLVPDSATGAMRVMRAIRHGMQSVDQCEREAQALGLLASTKQMAWLYERQRAIEAKLLTDLPGDKRRNWEAARDFINTAIERRSERE